MNIKIESSWGEALKGEFSKEYFERLASFVKEQYATRTIYPEAKNIFRAFDCTPLNKVKVVILGQDPYHGEGQANGLCFSVSQGVKSPPSLVNIFKELELSLGITPPQNGDLSSWAEQGVLLLNSTLTVEAHKAGSHQKKGWEQFTDAAIGALSQQREGVVYMLWGSYAQKKGAVIDRSKNLVLTSVHPSPLSAYRGFIGCNHFAQANEYLISRGEKPIQWAL